MADDRPTADGGGDGSPPTVLAGPRGGFGEQPSDWIGPYKLLEIIGEGGFGTVWLAERREPMVQRVALKIIKPGMDSKAVIARFEQERQALAVMDHPNVAKVFDGGVTPTGRPYFVMEHVKGEPIADYCDRHRLTMRERLELFISVCEAVQHAHMKGIIHRDIKPSNILVAPGGEGLTPIVKVIDFGVAKAISHTLTDKTIFTEHGQIIGTPEYMSPEQAEMGATDIDTRTDVYSLGVVLYELLSGTLPFEPKTLRSAGYAEIQRIIREVDPPRPSTKLSAADEETGATISKARHAERESITGELRRELDWIPLKAIRKDRRQRYTTAHDLAEDVRRYLNGDALDAGPESGSYRLRKAVLRNRELVASVVAVVVALCAGLASTVWQASRANERAEAARQAGLLASQRASEAETARNNEAAAKRTAERAAYSNLLQASWLTIDRGLSRQVFAQIESCEPTLRGWEWHLQRARLVGDPLCREVPAHFGQLDTHDEAVISGFTADGSQFFANGRDGVSLYDTVTGSQVGSKRLPERNRQSRVIAVAPSLEQVVVESIDGLQSRMTLVAFQSGAVLRDLGPWIANRIPVGAFSRNDRYFVCWSKAGWSRSDVGGLEVENGDTALIVWDLEAKSEPVVIHTAERWFDPTVTNEGALLSTRNGSVRIDLASAEVVDLAASISGSLEQGYLYPIWRGHAGEVFPVSSSSSFAPQVVAASHDGTLVAALTARDSIQLLRAVDGGEVATWVIGTGNPIAGVWFSEDDSRLAVRDDRGYVLMWPVTRGHALPLDIAPYIAASTQNGSAIVVAGDSFTHRPIRIIDATVRSVVGALPERLHDVRGLMVAADGSRLLTLNHEELTVWLGPDWVRTTSVEWEALLREAEPRVLRANRIQAVCNGTADQVAVLAELYEATDEPNTVRSVAYGVALFDGRSQVWKCQLIRTESGPGQTPTLAALPDGRSFLVIEPARVREFAWTGEPGGIDRSITGDGFDPSAAAVSPRGDLVAIAGRNDDIVVVTLTGPEQVRRIAAQWAFLPGVGNTPADLYNQAVITWAADGSRVFTAGMGGTIVQVWDPAEPRRIMALPLDSPVRGLCFIAHQRALCVVQESGLRFFDSHSAYDWLQRVGKEERDFLAARRSLRRGAGATSGEPSEGVATYRRRLELLSATLARGEREAEAERTGQAAWDIVKTVGRSASDYRRACDDATKAVADAPEWETYSIQRYRVTLGVANYRLGDYTSAIRLLSMATKGESPAEAWPVAIAYLAMAKIRLGDRDGAQELILALDRPSMDDQAVDAELQAALVELAQLK